MNYSKACETLGFTTPKSLEDNARLAASRLHNMRDNAPLRYSVACQVLLDAAR